MTPDDWTPHHEQTALNVAREWRADLPASVHGRLPYPSGTTVTVTPAETLDLVRRAYLAGAIAAAALAQLVEDAETTRKDPAR